MSKNRYTNKGKIPKYQKRWWLVRWYVERQLTPSRIAKKAKCSRATVCYWLERHGINIRGNSEAQKLYFKKNPRTVPEQNPNFKGGRTVDAQGYVRVLMPSHPYSNKRGYCFGHRLASEEGLGRYLFPWETPHHRNGIRDDNRWDNILVFESKGDHSKFEAFLRKSDIENRGRELEAKTEMENTE